MEIILRVVDEGDVRVFFVLWMDGGVGEGAV